MTDEGHRVEYDPKAAGLRVQQLRERRGLTQEELAELADLTRQYVNEFEHGEQARARRGTLKRLAQALGWPTWQAMVGTDALEPPANTAAAVPTSPSAEPSGPATGGAGLGDHGADRPLPLMLGDQPGMTRDPVVLVPVRYVGRGNAGEGGGHVAEGEIVAVDTRHLRGLSAGRVGVIKIVGNCLQPRVVDGDYAYLDADGSPVAGALVAVRVRDTEELIVKFWAPQPDGSVLLVPAPNSGDGTPRAFDADNMDVLGVVFQALRPIGIESLTLDRPELRLVTDPAALRLEPTG